MDFAGHRILKLLQEVTPALCAACLAYVTRLPEPHVLDVATDLIVAGRLNGSSPLSVD